MAQLVLVRHGQATPFENITDRLSPLGEAQSRKLAEYWIRNGVQFDAVYTGPLVRQRRTAGLASAGGGLAAEVVPELAEYDAESILRRLGPQLAARDAGFRQLVEESASGGGSDRNRRYQKMFETLMQFWIAGELDSPEVESWSDFRQRVERGLRRLMLGSGSGRRVAAFTSGGPIGVAVQMAVGAPARSALELSWRVRNCSLTGFLFSGDRLSLDTFNATPHLDDPALLTYR